MLRGAGAPRVVRSTGRCDGEDFDPEVTGIASQPFWSRRRRDGRVRRHAPDFLVIGRDGGVRVVNVKPADQLKVPKVADALAWAGEVFAAQGWQHEIWSGAEPVFLANVRFLAGYRFADRVEASIAEVIARDAPSGATIGELEQGWPDRAGDARAAVLHLLWRGVFRTGLMVPLSAATRGTPPAWRGTRTRSPRPRPPRRARTPPGGRAARPRCRGAPREAGASW